MGAWSQSKKVRWRLRRMNVMPHPEAGPSAWTQVWTFRTLGNIQALLLGPSDGAKGLPCRSPSDRCPLVFIGRRMALTGLLFPHPYAWAFGLPRKRVRLEGRTFCSFCTVCRVAAKGEPPRLQQHMLFLCLGLLIAPTWGFGGVGWGGCSREAALERVVLGGRHTKMGGAGPFPPLGRTTSLGQGARAAPPGRQISNRRRSNR